MLEKLRCRLCVSSVRVKTRRLVEAPRDAAVARRAWLHTCSVRHRRGSRGGLLANAVSKITSPKLWEREFGS